MATIRRAALAALDYVVDGAYRSEPDLQNYLKKHNVEVPHACRVACPATAQTTNYIKGRITRALALVAPASDVRIRLTGAGIAAPNASSTDSQT